MLTSSGFTNVKTNNVLQENKLAGRLVTEPGINGTPDINNKPLRVLLVAFESHSLSDLSKAGLMRRVDTKYLLPVSGLKELLMQLVPFYTVLEIDSSRLFSYRSTYLDTSGYGFYMMHHNGKQDRFKIRHRLYVESGAQYLEVKHKTNKKVTQKDRILLDGHNTNSDCINDLVSKPFGGSCTPLSQSLICSYTRIAFANEKNGERLTLDLNISFEDPNQMRKKALNNVLIAEVKREDRGKFSVFMDQMKRFRQQPVSFSKYCIGCALLHSERIKTNRFKATLMALDRISYEETRIAA